MTRMSDSHIQACFSFGFSNSIACCWRYGESLSVFYRLFPGSASNLTHIDHFRCTSSFGSLIAGGDNGSFSSGIVSCCVPLTTLELTPVSSVGSGPVPLGLSPLDRRVCLGDPDASDARGVNENLLA